MTYLRKEADLYRVGMWGAILVLVGTLLSGPAAFLLVSAVRPQPPWADPAAYVAAYHPIQSVTFYFGFLLLIGSVVMVAVLYLLEAGGIRLLLALIFTAIACGLVGFNYFTEATLIPALVRYYEPAWDPIINLFAVTNPLSLFWAIEMWGYGFLGLGTWLAAGAFADRGVERAAKVLFVLNGVMSVAGALWTGLRLEWVLSTAGLVAYGLWNLLYVILAAVYLIVMRRRRAAV